MKKSIKLTDLLKEIKEQNSKKSLDDIVKSLNFIQLTSIINHFQDDFTVSDEEISEELRKYWGD